MLVLVIALVMMKRGKTRGEAKSRDYVAQNEAGRVQAEHGEGVHTYEGDDMGEVLVPSGGK